MRERRVGEGGFTAVEVLAALAILALVGALLAVGFRRHVGTARAAEATSMLMELARKEQAFRAQAGHYAPLRADAAGELPSGDESPEAFYPQPADSPRLASARRTTRISDRDLWPPAWRAVGVRPSTELPYCTYLVNAGDKGRPDAAMDYGAKLLPDDVAGPWFYALAACNMAGSARFPGGVTVYGLSSENLSVRTFDEGS
jgi:prepilin-type N-terminal cleavage/methylation domain-containing protein